jgi:hypothetical protein
MVDESSIPNFPKTFEQFKSSQPQGIPVADRKYSGVLLKRLMALAKPKKALGKSGKSGRKTRGGKSSLVASNKLTFHHNSPKFY